MKIDSLKILTAALMTSLCLVADEGCTYTESCGKFSVYGDYLYLQAREENLVYAFQQEIVATGPLSNRLSTQEQSPLSPSFDWDSGFRIGAVYENDEKDLKGEVKWLHFCTTAKDSLTVDPYSIVAPNQNTITMIDIFSPSFFNTTNNFAAVSNSVKIKTDWVDLAFSKRFSPFCHAWISTEIGGRYLYLSQQYNTNGTSPSTVSPIRNYVSRGQVTSWGCGLEATLAAGYNLPCGLGIKGFFGGAILYSEYKIRNNIANSTTTFPVIVLTSIVSDYKYKTTLGTPMLDMGFSLVYDLEIFGYSIDLHAGWEQHILYNVNQTQKGGNLSLSGINAGAEISF